MKLYRQKNCRWSGKLIGGPEFQNGKHVTGAEVWMGNNLIDEYIIATFLKTTQLLLKDMKRYIVLLA